MANSVSSANHYGMSSCVQQKNEFASLPRFLRRGVGALGGRPRKGEADHLGRLGRNVWRFLFSVAMLATILAMLVTILLKHAFPGVQLVGRGNALRQVESAKESPFQSLATDIEVRRTALFPEREKLLVKIICRGSKVEAEWRRKVELSGAAACFHTCRRSVEAEWRRKVELSGPRWGTRQQWGPAARVKAEE